MSLNVNTCPLCNEKQSTLFDQRNFRGYQVSNRLCSNCGLVYQSPRLSDDELESFYQNEYRQVYQGCEQPVQKDLTVQIKRASSLIKVLQENGFENIDRHLDIGSSSGILLERIGEEFQCQVVGIEPGEAYRSYAENSGLRVYASIEDLKNAGELPFDLITMVHVLEHLPKPVNYLKELKGQWLRPDGVLLIEVPNLYAHNCFEIAHLTSFSQFTLEETLKKAGYSIKVLIKHGRPRSNLIPLYITILATPSKNSQGQNKAHRERGIRMKRRAGMFHRRIIEHLFPKQAWLSEFHE
jgi:2-polyprenyl-3-methyl-5-hydroxy-6-metoxy-1,4-benzoquinol methylase